MARDGSHGNSGVVSSIAKEVQKKLGLLAVFIKQRPMDCLGRARQRVCADFSATVPRFS